MDRVEKREPVREQLIEAATRLLAGRGIETVNSNRIARAAGVGVGTFYNHFEDKHALHRELAMRAFEQLGAALGRASEGLGSGPGPDIDPDLDPDPPDVEVQVRALVEATVEFAARQPELFRVGFGRSLPPAGKGRPAMAFSIRPVEQRLRALQREGRLDMALNPEVAARGFAGMQSAVLLGWLDEPERFERRDIIETLVRLHPAVAARVRRPTGAAQ